MLARRYLCLGGPLDGKMRHADELPPNEYMMYNCGQRVARTKFHRKASAARGEVVPPSAVFIHLDLFPMEAV